MREFLKDVTSSRMLVGLLVIAAIVMFFDMMVAVSILIGANFTFAWFVIASNAEVNHLINVNAELMRLLRSVSNNNGVAGVPQEGRPILDGSDYFIYITTIALAVIMGTLVTMFPWIAAGLAFGAIYTYIFGKNENQ